MPFPKRSARFFTVAILLIGMLVLSACAGATTEEQTTFVGQGSSSQEILNLFRPVFWLAVGVFVIVEGLLIWSVFRYRRKPQDGIPLQIHGNTRVEIAWTILPAVIVVGIATMTFNTQARLERPPENPLNITVVGHQWWWEFRYTDDEYNFVTANELHLPAGRDIQFTLTSADVIHSFWLPRLAGKTDTIPGHANRLSFRANEVTEPTLIRGECAEFCGGTHAQMGMYAVVDPPATFEEWAQGQKAPAVTPAGVTPPDSAAAGVSATVQAQIDATSETQPGATATGGEAGVDTVATLQAQQSAAPAATDTPTTDQPISREARGYEVFATKGCVACHAINGRPDAVGITGPNLTHVGSRSSIVAGWLENTPENMKRWLRDPNGVKPENLMARQIKLGTLTEEEIDALTAYLQSLK